MLPVCKVCLNKLGSKLCQFWFFFAESLFQQTWVNYSFPPCQNSLYAFILLEMLVTEKKTRPQSVVPTLPVPVLDVRGSQALAMLFADHDRDPGALAASGQQGQEVEARGRCDDLAPDTGQGHRSDREIY